MTGSYRELVEAAIRHLEDLRRRGTRFVPVTPETLAALKAPRPVRARASSAPVAAPPAESAGAPPTSTRPAPQAAGPRVVTPGTEPASAASAAAGRTAPASGPTVAGQRSLGLAGSVRGPLGPAEKEAAMAALRARASACRKCEHLAASRRTVVFGVGTVHTELMFVGEAPGADEDAQGEPFVGKAGQLLTRIIQTMGLDRDKVYIANILKCRPDTPGQASGNRKPTPTEMVTCLPYLLEQIEIIQPKVVVALGATAIEGLMGKTEGITRIRGRWLEFRGVPLMPTYHPAYLLRNQAPSEKRKVWEDMLKVMERLGLPISEKQRGFFLRG